MHRDAWKPIEQLSTSNAKQLVKATAICTGQAISLWNHSRCKRAMPTNQKQIPVIAIGIIASKKKSNRFWHGLEPIILRLSELAFCEWCNGIDICLSNEYYNTFKIQKHTQAHTYTHQTTSAKSMLSIIVIISAQHCVMNNSSNALGCQTTPCGHALQPDLSINNVSPIPAPTFLQQFSSCFNLGKQ